MSSPSDTNGFAAMLLPVRTDQIWFHDHVVGAADLYFFRGRIQFGAADGVTPSSNREPSMLVVYGGSEELEQYSALVQSIAAKTPAAQPPRAAVADPPEGMSRER